MKAPMVSILTPVYNHEQFVAACIESVLAQTYPNWEQIIIDDGSDDTTREVIRRYSDPRIHYWRQDHVGIGRLADTYNRALAQARGEMISILEGDDLWVPEKLGVLVPMLEDPAVVLAYGQTNLILSGRDTGKTLPPQGLIAEFGMGALWNDPVGTATRAMLRGHIRVFIHPGALLLRREALDAIGGFEHVPGLFAVDYPMCLRLSMAGKFGYSDRVVAFWRRHPLSSSWLNQKEMMKTAHDYSLAFIRQHDDKLKLTPLERRKIDLSWRRWLQRNALATGRLLLLQGQWKRSRPEFLRALFSADPLTAIGAAIGYISSWLHRDVEDLVAYSGHVHLKEQPPVTRQSDPD